MEIKGNISGVRLQRRGPGDPHVCIQLLREDDDYWFEVGSPLSSYWLNDLIQVLQLAKSALESQVGFEKDEYGYRFTT